MRAHIESGNVFGLYTVHLEDGRTFHDRTADQVRRLIAKHGLVEKPSRDERAALITTVVQEELGPGVEVEWTAADDIVTLTCVFGGRTHVTRVLPLDDDEERARAWCRSILREA